MLFRQLAAAVLLFAFAQQSHATITLRAGSVSTSSGASISIPINVTNFSQVVTFQFSLHWDTSVLQFSGATNSGLPGLGSGNFGNGQNGTLTVSWDDADFTGKAVTNGAALFNVQFSVIGSGGTSSAIQLDGTPLSIEFTDADFNTISNNTQNGSVTVSGIGSGDRIIADRGPYLSTGTILLVDHNSNAQRIISTRLSDPYEIDLDAAGNIIVADYQTGRGPAGGGIFKIDHATFAQTTISIGGNFTTPLGVKVEKTGAHAGKILVADSDAYNLAGAVFRIDPGTGVQTTLSTGNLFFWLQGLTLGGNGDIYLTDRGDGGGTPAKLIKVDPVTGAQTLISSGGNLIRPVGLVVEGTDLLVADPESRKIIRVPIATGVQSVVSTDALLIRPTHIGIDPASGDYYVTDGKANAPTGQRKLHRISHANSALTVLSTDGFFDQPRGIVIVP